MYKSKSQFLLIPTLYFLCSFSQFALLSNSFHPPLPVAPEGDGKDDEGREEAAVLKRHGENCCKL